MKNTNIIERLDDYSYNNETEIQYLGGEIWKPYLEYMVSNLGRVYSLRRRCMLKPELARSRSCCYYRVGLYHAGTMKHYRISRLVAELFCENPDPEHKTVVHHRNVDSIDNRASNLVWMTPAEHREEHRRLREQISDGKEVIHNDL